MTNNKHTPGPWEADFRTGCFAVRRKGDKLNCLSEASRDSIVFQNGRSEDLSEPNGYRYLTDEQIANAHLIAAAPELMEALEKAKAFLVTAITRGEVKMSDYEELVSDIENTISKAKGDSENN